MKQHLWPQGSVGPGSPRSRDHRALGSAAIKTPNCSSQMTRVQIHLGVTGAARTPRCRALQNTPKNSTGCLPAVAHRERGRGQGAAERGPFGTRCVLSPRRGWCGCERATAVPAVGCAGCWLCRLLAVLPVPRCHVGFGGSRSRRRLLPGKIRVVCAAAPVCRTLSCAGCQAAPARYQRCCLGPPAALGLLFFTFFFFLLSPSFMEFGVC